VIIIFFETKYKLFIRREIKIIKFGCHPPIKEISCFHKDCFSHVFVNFALSVSWSS